MISNDIYLTIYVFLLGYLSPKNDKNFFENHKHI